MTKFEGGKFQVRCVDCIKLSGNLCLAKKIGVKPKKKRTCTAYNFKGEYENRTPAEAVYIPPVDKKTVQLMKKLMQMGVITVNTDGTPQLDEFEQSKALPMPASTATAGLVGVKPVEDPLNYQVQHQVPKEDGPKEDQLIWTPKDDE